MKIIIVDDNDTFRNLLKEFLLNKLNHEVIASVSSGEDFLKLDNINSTDIVLMDIELSGINGIDTTRKILISMPYLKIIAITMHREGVFLLQLIEAGFKGTIFKDDIFNNITSALQDVYSGKLYFDIRIDPKNQV